MKVSWKFWLPVLALVAFNAAAAPVEYVRICGGEPGFFYIPGTDTCTNAVTGESRTATEGGVWVTQDAMPAGEWVGSARKACRGVSRLVHLGTITKDDLTLNSHSRYETAPLPLTLASGEFISRLMIRGGFEASSRSSFCFMYYDATLDQYSVAGCHPQTRALVGQEAIWSFVPLRPAPPSTFTGPVTLVGTGGSEPWPLPADISGEMDAWACVERVRGLNWPFSQSAGTPAD